MPLKKAVIFRRVSSIVLSFPRQARSILAPGFSSISRNPMQSMYPLAGKDSSNITMSLISSVSTSRLRISLASLENSSIAAFSAAYSVLHRSEIIFLILSNPSCDSNFAVSIILLNAPHIPALTRQSAPAFCPSRFSSVAGHGGPKKQFQFVYVTDTLQVAIPSE